METVKGPDSKEKRIEHMISLYQLPLLRLCIMYLHDEEQAKDAVQETFIKAYRNLDSFRADSSEKTWLTRIAINTCKNVYRTGWFRYIDRTVTLDMITERPAPAATEDDELTTEIMNLPVKLREVALLCWLQGMGLRRSQRKPSDISSGCRQPLEPCKKETALCFGRK